MRRSANLQRLLLLGLTCPVIGLNVWILSQVYRYFEGLFSLLAVAAILSFLLNYPVRWLERTKFSRTQAVSVVLLVALTLLVVLGVTLVPTVIEQSVQLFRKIPDWLTEAQQNIQHLDFWARQRRLPINLQDLANQVNRRIEDQVQALVSQVLGLALGTVSGLVNFLLVIVLAFYMLLYGDRLWQGVIKLLPRRFGTSLSASLQLNFHNFLISQLLLGLFMFVALTPIFWLMGVSFALLFALIIGVANLIPLIGAALGIGLVILLVMFQNLWLSLQVAIAAVVVQQIKDNLLGPRLMGDIIGLNPIWIFVALLAGGQIAGLLGVFVAVPIAGTIKLTFDELRHPYRRPSLKAAHPVDAATPGDSDPLG
ncbi:AI-2E family transporter [Neosynechococcus sphagnicola]|uniref:AI-2E family transporter n=1 Tax=Neosynechococcus sphagnicola TaxID=1501145 RepID=UPI0005621427|nr:AI-2E family transporter [Neosynechococcus sphagnicola]